MIYRVKELRENEPLRFFEPNGAQMRYIEAVGKPEGFIVLFSAGNGVGKTAATVAIIASIIWPEMAPKEFKSWIYQSWPYPKHFRIVSTPQEISEGGSLQNEIKKWFPVGQYDAVKNGKTYNSQYTARGYTIDLMSYDMADTAFEGATCGLVAFNEPPKKSIFNACAARMRKGGRLLFPGTPLMDAAWIMDDLVSKADGEYIQLVPGDIEQNCREHSPNGQLAHADIERMVKNYDPDELEARAHGKFMHLSGRIFKTFDRSVHVRAFDIPNSGVSHGMALDPAIGKPIFALWRFVDKRGVLHYYDEWPDFPFANAKDSNLTVMDYVQLIKAREEGRNVEQRILDRHFGNARRTMGGLTLRQEFSEAGLDFADSYTMDPQTEVEQGILAIKGVLKYDASKPIDALNTPRIVIHPKCTNLIGALERWSRDSKTAKPKDDANKDPIDCLRYDVMSAPKPDDGGDWPTTKRPFYKVET